MSDVHASRPDRTPDEPDARPLPTPSVVEETPAEEPLESEVVDELAAWQTGIDTRSAFVRYVAGDYPAWLEHTFGRRVIFYPYTGQRFGVFLDGQRIQWGRMNKRGGASITLPLTKDGPAIERLKDLTPQSGFYVSPLGSQFTLQNDADYAIFQEVMRLIGGLEPKVVAVARPYEPAALQRLIARFQQHYAGFSHERYYDAERFYKEQIAERIRSLIGRERLEGLIAAGDFDGAKTAIKQACGGSFRTPSGSRQQNNLLGQWDLQVIDATAAEPLARHLYDLLYGDGAFAERFEAWVDLLTQHKPGVWPLATYFLALLYPATHIFVRPTPFQIFARVIDDMIDVQSFIWVVQERTEAKAWIFQANLDNYDLPSALGELDELDWGARQHADKIKVGDTVYLWESGANAGLLAVTRVTTEPAVMPEAERELRFYRDPSRLKGAERRVRLRIEQVLAQRLPRRDLQDDPVLQHMAILRNAQGTNFALTADEATTLAALVEAAVDDSQPGALEIPRDDERVDRLGTWQASIDTLAPFNRDFVQHLPAWLAETFGNRAAFIPSTGQRFSVHLDGSRSIWGRVNKRSGVLLRIADRPDGQLLEQLHLFSPPLDFAQDRYGIVCALTNDTDYAAFQEAMELILAPAMNVLSFPTSEPTLPPDPPDGPVFVVIHKADWLPYQELGQSYVFTRKAGGAPVQLLGAVNAWQAGGPPIALVIYRPGPHFVFLGWAQVTGAREERRSEADETLHVLTYAWHPFPVPVRAHALQSVSPWLSKGLAIAFKGKSIQALDPDDLRRIVERAYPGERKPMTIADAAFTILTRAGGGPLHLSDILTAIQNEGLAELRGQTPQLSLASILLRDERFHNLGRNTWVLAAADADEEADEVDEEALATVSEPPTRLPAIYAEEDARFWRIHFPRELWASARRNGVIAIGWPPDAQNQSVKRFRQITVGDRIVAYVQGGTIGGIGLVVRAFDPESPRAGLAAEALGDEFNQYLHVAWSDAPSEPHDLLAALRHASYTNLYNRIKNPHTVIPLSRDDYVELLSLLQVDDAGEPRSASRLPAAWEQLTPFEDWARITRYFDTRWHSAVDPDDPGAQVVFDTFVDAVWEIRHIRNQAAHTNPVPRDAYSRLFRNVCQGGPLRVGALNALVRAWST